ncbi:MAG: hypothetical protein H0U63_08395 [Burkholderiales bacterium]|nr:hypothetical protein [Burkholderiales bacterium]
MNGCLDLPISKLASGNKKERQAALFYWRPWQSNFALDVCKTPEKGENRCNQSERKMVSDIIPNVIQ